MEIPAVSIEVLKSEYNIKLYSNENHQYNIIVQNLSNSINIKASYQDDILKHDYEKIFLLDELKKNKYLLMCDTIDEIYDELVNLLKKNKTKILENINEISIIIPLESLKIKEIIFILTENTKKDEENVKCLVSVISEMKKEINQLKETNIQLNNKIISLEQENKIFKQKLDIFEDYLPFIKALKIDINSLIIGNNTL